MTREEFYNLLERYEKGQATEQDIKLFDSFFHSIQSQKELSEEWDISVKERIRLEIHNGIKLRLAKNLIQPKERVSIVWKVAASLVLIVGVSFGLYLNRNITSEIQYITKTAKSGQQATINLSDGSIVKLNAGSSITFPENFTGEIRDVSLLGEAFFEVKSNAKLPFIVKTGELKTTVLGTSFNINAHNPNYTSITLVEGKVAVEMDSYEELLLPGEQMIFDKEMRTLTKKAIDIENELAWRKGIIQFNETSLTQVIDILERWYDTDIILVNDELINCKISGKFNEDRIKNVLEGLTFLIDIQYETQDYKEIYITGKGCKITQ